MNKLLLVAVTLLTLSGCIKEEKYSLPSCGDSYPECKGKFVNIQVISSFYDSFWINLYEYEVSNKKVITDFLLVNNNCGRLPIKEGYHYKVMITPQKWGYRVEDTLMPKVKLHGCVKLQYNYKK